MKIKLFLFLAMTVISIKVNCQDNYNYFKTKFDSILEKYPVPLLDTDNDGIEDLMEKEFGTSITNSDSDSDGLDDYEEIFKYKTDPNKKDSDGDDLIDSVWTERIEFNYVLKIIAHVGKPYNSQNMNTFCLDARILEEFPDYAVIEYIVYPFAEPYLVPLINTTQSTYIQQKYLEVDTLTKLSETQLKEIKGVIKESKSDLERTIQLINYIWDNYELKDELFSQCEPLMEILISNNEITHTHKGWSPEELYEKYDFQTILNLNCISDEMVKNKSRGACGSTATLIAAIFKNAGIPARIKQNFPFITEKDSSQVALINNVENEYSILDKFRNGMYGDNHFFNEIFINGHWIDLDTYRLGNKWQYKPYLKSVHFNNWSEVNFAKEWHPWIQYDKTSEKSLKIRYKAYKTIALEEIKPKY